MQGTRSDMERSGATQWVGVWREEPRGTEEKRSGEAKVLVLGKIYRENDFGDRRLKDRIDKRYRVTEGFWNPTGKIEREGNGFYQIEDQSLRMEEPNKRIWTRLNKRGGEQEREHPRMWNRIRRNVEGIWGRINKRGMTPEVIENRKWHRVFKREQVQQQQQEEDQEQEQDQEQDLEQEQEHKLIVGGNYEPKGDRWLW